MKQKNKISAYGTFCLFCLPIWLLGVSVGGFFFAAALIPKHGELAAVIWLAVYGLATTAAPLVCISWFTRADKDRVAELVALSDEHDAKLGTVLRQATVLGVLKARNAIQKCGSDQELAIDRLEAYLALTAVVERLASHGYCCTCCQMPMTLPPSPDADGLAWCDQCGQMQPGRQVGLIQSA